MIEWLGTELPEVKCVTLTRFADARGIFWEAWRADRYASLGIPGPFVQDNISRSRQGVLRGLHFQCPAGQGKLVSVLEGEILDFAVDIRRGSPTLRRWTGLRLAADEPRQLYIPPGFAHGFLVLSASALVHYKCTEFYQPAAEHTLRWDDPELGLPWPIATPELSEKDRAGLFLSQLPASAQPEYP